MDVYLVPVAADRHELYCEVPDEPAPEETLESTEPPEGFFRRVREWFRFRRLRARFREMLAEAERERRLARPTPVEGGWLARVKARSMCWVAESIAEQRLLWHLRQQTEACLLYPDDLSEEEASAAVRSSLKRDFEKHRFWLTIDGLLFVASGLLALVPGPNILAYYFAFRVVGHYFSLRGARQGLSGIAWRNEKSEALSELRRAIGLAPDARERRVHELALRLRLEHLASFFERTAIPMS
jgi:hypothetical protein